MPSHHNTIYDFMADAFRQSGLDRIALDRIIMDAEQEGFLDIWEIPRAGMANAMKVRGLELANGELKYPERDGEPFDPIETDYAEFKQAARQIMDEAEYPMDAVDLIERTGLHASAAPLSSMRYHLKQVGIHWLPGIGYWKHPQYTDADGRVISKRIRSERVKALLQLFEDHGWPISGRDAEMWSGGLVTSRFLTKYASDSDCHRISGIGSGLYVPMDRKPDGPIPMSRNVYDAVAGIDDGTILDDKDNHRLFRIMLIAERLGWVQLTKSRTTRDRVRRQTAKVKWTDEGTKKLRRIEKKTADEF